MADLISEVIDLQVFEQVKKLTADLETLYGVMDKTIALGAGNNKIIDPQGMKAATDATNNLNNTVTKLMETESERLNIERQIKAEGEKMAASVKIQSNAIEQAAAKYKMFSNSQKELAQYIMETDRRLAEIKTELKNADTSASNYAEATANLKIEQAKLKAELSEATKELKRTVTEQKFADDSMKGMSVRLLQLKDLYSQFTETERNSEFGMTISQGINELDEKLKGLDKSIGDNQRSVGNYEVAGKSLRMQLREIVQELAMQKFKMDESKAAIIEQEGEVNRLANSLGKNSTEYQESKAKLDAMKLGLQNATAAMSQLEREGGKIKDVMDDANRSIKGMADDAGNTAAMAQGVGVLADSFSVFQAGMVAVGADGEDLMKIYAKMMIIQQGFNSLTQITNALQAESTLRLKLKAVWDKVNLAFTEKKTAATVKETAAETVNAAATTAGATATAGLATAEGVATTTSWTLVGSLKAVGVAIKSIPVIGWILAAVAALGTLTVLLYKHLSAEKELTAEQMRRKQLTKEQQEINQKAFESTFETLTRVRLLQKELKNVKQGSEQWKNIVEQINDLTGSNLDTIKASPKEIAKVTEAWIAQYKIRAKAEATIQKIVQNELDFQQLFLDVQNVKADERKSTIDKLLLSPDQKKELLDQLNLLKSNASATDKAYASKNVQYYLKIARDNMIKNNDVLEQSITLEGLVTEEKKKQNTENQKVKSYQNEILKLKAELYLSGEDLLIENTRIELAISEQKYQEELKDLKEKNKSTEDLTKLHQLEIEKIQRDGYEKLREFRQKNFEDIVEYNRKENEEREKQNQKFIDDATTAQNEVLAGSNKYFNEQTAIMQKQIEINEKRIQSIYELVDSFASLGSAIAGNIEDEEKRVKVEQRIAEVQLAVTNALAIAEVLLDKGGDPWLKAIRIAANLAVVTAGFIQAENTIKQAGSVSSYAEGTDYHKGGAALIGEGVKNNQYQPELLTIGNKSTWITEPTYFPELPIGASVTPIAEFQNNQQFDDMKGGRETKLYVDVSGRILPTLIKEGKVIKFANKIITARG